MCIFLKKIGRARNKFGEKSNSQNVFPFNNRETMFVF